MCPGRDDIAPSSRQKTEQADDAGDADAMDAEIQQASFQQSANVARACMQLVPCRLGEWHMAPWFHEVPACEALGYISSDACSTNLLAAQAC